MKRMLSILILILITSFYVSNLLYTLNYKEEVKTTSKKNSKLKISKIEIKKNKKETKTKSSINKVGNSKIDLDNIDNIQHTATWYTTYKHPKVHREHPTAAYNSVPKGTWLMVKNINTGDSCVVEVTDRNGMGKYHIDLSHSAFGYLSKHSVGNIKVLVKKIDKQ